MESGHLYLFAGYTLIWTVIFIYLLSLGHKQKKLIRALDLLRDQLAENHHQSDL